MQMRTRLARSWASRCAIVQGWIAVEQSPTQLVRRRTLVTRRARGESKLPPQLLLQLPRAMLQSVRRFLHGWARERALRALERATSEGGDGQLAMVAASERRPDTVDPTVGAGFMFPDQQMRGRLSPVTGNTHAKQESTQNNTEQHENSNPRSSAGEPAGQQGNENARTRAAAVHRGSGQCSCADQFDAQRVRCTIPGLNRSGGARASREPEPSPRLR